MVSGSKLIKTVMQNRVDETQEIRIDKWLWAVRLFKTRSQSAEACRKGRVTIDDIPVKPSRAVKAGDIIYIRKPPSVFRYKVLAPVEKRQSAKIAAQYLEDITPDEEKDKFMHKNLIVFAKRDRGAGRPTKKERRIIDKLSKTDL